MTGESLCATAAGAVVGAALCLMTTRWAGDTQPRMSIDSACGGRCRHEYRRNFFLRCTVFYIIFKLLMWMYVAVHLL